MATNAREEYLAGQITTATPQQQQMMLIEAALRFAQQAQHQWEVGDDESAGSMLIRSQEIVCELLAARAAAGTPLGRRSSSVYAFVHRALIEAHMLREPAKVDDALRVLEVERDTWR
ncbi:MAG: flagellar export chaperone FliS, partial [Pirellulales bacterium]